MDWQTLIDEEAIGALLDDDYAHLARPVSEALAVFLGGLPGAAQRAIVAGQMALPARAGISERLGALARQCPVLHKLGQTLARDRRLAPALRYELRRLEVLPPSVPARTIRDTLEHELGPLGNLDVRLEPAAIAEASVAVVIGYRQRGRRGVFKVLKPGIEERLELELELLGRVGELLDERCAELGIPKLGYEEAFQHIREKLRDEVRLHVEQAHLSIAGEQYADCRWVRVPALHEHCSARVTAMERLSGRKVTRHRTRTAAEKRRLATLLTTALLAEPVFSTRDLSLVHGDPHAGNLLLTSDGRLAVLDWSLAGVLTRSDREAIVQIVLGALLLDERQVVDRLGALAAGAPPDRERLRSVVRRHLRGMGFDRLPDVRWLVALIDDAVAHAGLRGRGDLLLFRKSLHTLAGVVADTGAGEGAMDRAVLLDFLHRLASEWPQRWLQAPDSRAFATRLSSADLTRLALSGPSAVARFWLGQIGRPYPGAAPHHA